MTLLHPHDGAQTSDAAEDDQGFNEFCQSCQASDAMVSYQEGNPGNFKEKYPNFKQFG